jgi:hypothetical protein
VRQNCEEIDRLLHPLGVVLAWEADVILDLRDLLLTQGHPGKCVRCFFRLFEAAGDDGKVHLAPLKAWLERNVEIFISGDGEVLETLPFALHRDEDLEGFCLRAIDHIRMDRGYSSSRLQLAFRYKAAA